MVIVDSSVWIDYFAGREHLHTLWLVNAMKRSDLGLTDMILCEVLQGMQSKSSFDDALRELTDLRIFDTGGELLAIRSANNYRLLRSKGKTVRTTLDCLIATFCMTHGHTLLHRDRDFDAFEKHLGLQVVRPAKQ